MSDQRLGNISSILSHRAPRRERLQDVASEPVAPVEDAPSQELPPAKGVDTVPSVAEGTAGQVTRKPAPKKVSKSPRKAPKSSEATGGTVRVALLLPPDLRTRLNERTVKDRGTLASTVFDAIEDALKAGTLDDAIAAQQAPPKRDGLLFDRTTRPEPAVLVELRMSAANRATLDHLTSTTEARTRTELITAALRTYLN